MINSSTFSCYRRVDTVTEAAWQAVAAWSVAVPLGILVRAIVRGMVVPPVSFVIVTCIATLVLLVGVRVGWFWLITTTGDDASQKE